MDNKDTLQQSQTLDDNKHHKETDTARRTVSKNL